MFTPIAIAQVRDYETRLREYEDLLIKVVQEQFPFDQKTEAQLEEYRNSLGLKAEDVAKIEERVKYEHQPKKQKTPPPPGGRFFLAFFRWCVGGYLILFDFVKGYSKKIPDFFLKLVNK
ncbi:hypothetical protein H6G06_01115 [Anabaena sphaerica FACHB-251]|uniref:Uncharacterized protein n=1 Tax=Anabaena sphaerica FACHB-251 TaxID=2692883 RepID=A0A926WDD5_9NOST|nr:hypothetical protein [Anabaena sphaerica]MBD2292112.1 hypothetical protein [Anabaena sphaerica FACHB-251]